MSRSYEELMGALGRGMFFRPERKRVRDLLSRHAEPRLVVAKTSYELFDVSMNGLSFVSPPANSWTIDAEIELELRLYGKPVYSGRARIVRTEVGRAGTRVGVALLSSFLDLPDILQQDEEGQLERALCGGPDQIHNAVPPAYREIVGRAVHMLQYYKRALDRHEARYRARGAGTHTSEALHNLTLRAATALRGQWLELERSASQVVLDFIDDAAAVRAAKEYTETVLTPLIVNAPMQQRSYTKPLGYPGDYQIMLYYYENAFMGESVFEQVFHKFFVEHPLSNGVRTRKDLMVELMQAEHERVVARSGVEATFQVTSLGCGPAREVAEYLGKRRDFPGQARWTLIDQEEETLSVAFRDCQHALGVTNSRGQVACLNLSFVQLLSDPSLLGALPPQDMIYSTGLFDYLREQKAQNLIEALYQRLAPGGLLAIGNALAPNLHFWSPEFILDWTLLYRTEAEMRRLGARLPSSAELDVRVEPGGAYYFLLVRKH